MSEDQLVRWIMQNYGVTRNEAEWSIAQYSKLGMSWLDIIRKIDFDQKVNRYSDAMQFA